MAFQQTLLENTRINPGEEKRLLPGLAVADYDRLHFHISGRGHVIPNLSVRILFGTPVGPVTLLADSTVWFEDTVSEREFSFTTSANYGHTGLVMSVPVVAPLLYDVILRNVGTAAVPSAYVTVMAQEI